MDPSKRPDTRDIPDIPDIRCTCSALRMAARRISQDYDAALAPEGLTVSQYAVLGNLARWHDRAAPPGRGEAAPSMTELSDLLGLDRTTLAHNLRPLERDGYVAVRPDARDARLRRVALTAAGRAKRDRCLPLWRAAQDRFDRSFGVERAETLRASLLALARGGEPDTASNAVRRAPRDIESHGEG